MNDPKIYGSRRRANLFYLWGHSYEFDNNNNWDHIEKICEKLANRDDIWYATNMEIYEYVTAYNSLIYSIIKMRYSRIAIPYCFLIH